MSSYPFGDFFLVPGRGDAPSARREAALGLAIGVGATMSYTAGVWVFAEPIARMFSQDAEVRSLFFLLYTWHAA